MDDDARHARDDCAWGRMRAGGRARASRQIRGTWKRKHHGGRSVARRVVGGGVWCGKERLLPRLLCGGGRRLVQRLVVGGGGLGQSAPFPHSSFLCALVLEPVLHFGSGHLRFVGNGLDEVSLGELVHCKVALENDDLLGRSALAGNAGAALLSRGGLVRGLVLIG